VCFKTTGFSQDGTIVIEFKRTVMIYKRGHVPERIQGPHMETSSTPAQAK
jgi:hypothetical protein